MARRSNQTIRSVIRVAVPVVLLAAALILYSSARTLDSIAGSPYPIRPALRFAPEMVAMPVWGAQSDRSLSGRDLPVEFSFRSGETLGNVLRDLALDTSEASEVVSALSQYIDVRRLRPVDQYAVLVDPESEMHAIRVTVAGKGRVLATRSDTGWVPSWEPFVEESRWSVLRGTLAGFLESAIVEAGGEAPVAYAMADVLQWDIDFNRDLRLGDRFEVLYESVFLDGQFHHVGEILALSFVNGGRRLEAYRFGADGGHYDAEGRPLRKLFLRSPLRYSRVTSGFSGRRFHPVLKRYRPHYGVDFGAPAGTPVRVTASGVVLSAGWTDGGGKTVRVRHPNGYVTGYLHLSRFAAGIGAGRRVRQGDVIGYVGATGLATAPHLDYRVQRDGKWLNPLTLDNQPAEPIPGDSIPEFEAWRDVLRATLASGEIPGELAPPTFERTAERQAVSSESEAKRGR